MRSTLGIVLAIGLLSVPAVADQEEAVRHPVAAEVLRLLEAGVGNDVIEIWLDRQPQVAEPVPKEELVALARAGANAEVLTKLIGLTHRQAPAAPGKPKGSRVVSDRLLVDIGPLATSFQYRLRWDRYRLPKGYGGRAAQGRIQPVALQPVPDVRLLTSIQRDIGALPLRSLIDL